MHPEADWDFFYGVLRRRTGLDLRMYKPEQLRRRIGCMVQSRGLVSLQQFWSELESDPKEVEWFLDKLAINVTELFRNPEKWAELKERVLPDLFKCSNRLKCWSAGCSIGAEAYTLAMLLDSEFPGGHQIMGSDIDAAALAQAHQGVFSEADMKCIPTEMRQKYFQPFQEGWRADVKLRRYLSFRRQNLLNDPFEGGYDLILCRNVVIYFTDEAKDRLYQRFYDSLKPGGYLFVGSTERIFQARQIGFESPIPFFYRKPAQEEMRWRNVS